VSDVASQATGSSLLPLQGWRIAAKDAIRLPGACLILPTYKRPDLIVSLLSVLAALPDAPAAVIVVDGSPDDATGSASREWATANSAPFELTYVKTPIAGLPFQRNVGLDICFSDYVYFLDDDCVPEPGYFRAIRDVLDQHPEVVAVAGLITNELNRPLALRWRLRFALGLLPRIEPGILHDSCTSVPPSVASVFAGIKYVDMFPGGASGFRRAIFDNVRYSPYLRRYATGEDLEMSLRMRRYGAIAWCGDAHVAHYHAAAGRIDSFQRGYMDTWNRNYIRRGHLLHASFVNKLRFWLDIFLAMTLDVFGFLRHPLQPRRLMHCLGMFCGVVSSVVYPPKYREPDTRPQFRFAGAVLDSRSSQVCR